MEPGPGEAGDTCGATGAVSERRPAEPALGSPDVEGTMQINYGYL